MSANLSEMELREIEEGHEWHDADLPRENCRSCEMEFGGSGSGSGLIEQDGAEDPDLETLAWCEYGWIDPSSAYREYSAYGITDADTAWKLRQAGVTIASLSEITERP